MRITKKATAGALAAVLVLGACRGSAEDTVETDEGAAATEAPGDSAATGDATATSDTTAPGDDDAAAETDTTAEGETAAAVECPASSPGLTDTSIKLGGTYPLSGPAAAYSSIPVGVKAYFDYLNDTDGGFVLSDGTVLEIEYVYLDDQYSPPKAVQNARTLVEQEEVFAILNPLGTPNNTAIREYMNTAEVPQILLATGASKWGKEIEQYPWTIGYQPDYESEGIAYVQYILSENPDAKIGVLYQNDDFGKDYLEGIKTALETQGKSDQLVSEVSYEVSDATVDNQVSQIKDAGVDAFVAIVTPQFAIQTIQRKAGLDWNPEIFVVSSVSSSVGAVWVPAGPENGDGAVTSAWLKDPTDAVLADDPGIIAYRELLEKYAPDANPDDGFHVHGVSVAQTFEALVEGMEGPLCRESLMAAVKDLEFVSPLFVEGSSFKTGPGDGFPLQDIQLKRFNADIQSWEAFGEIIDTAELETEEG